MGIVFCGGFVILWVVGIVVLFVGFVIADGFGL